MMSLPLRSVSAVLEASTLVVAALFPIVNPIGSAAVFLALVDRFDPSLQIRLAKKIAVYSFFLLFLSMLVGGKILSLLGVSLYSVQIAGGLVVAVNSWLLLSKDGDSADQPVLSADAVLMRAFYPFTLPFTVGPGSISVAVALGAHLPSELQVGSFSLLIVAASALGALVICASVYVCYRWAKSAEALLGSTGTEIAMRLSSFISLCIGVQIVAGGVRAYLATLH